MLFMPVLLLSLHFIWQPPDIDPPTTQPVARGGFRGRNSPTDRLRIVPPEQRDRAFKDRIVELAARNYQLDEMQKSLVRAEIDRMHAERVTAMGPDALAYDALRKEMNELWVSLSYDQAGMPKERRQRFRELRENERFREVNERLRELDAKYPFDWNNSMERIESILPPDIVEKGRQRRESRQSFRRVARPTTTQSGTQSSGEPAPQSDTQPPPPDAASPRSLHPWEQYTRKFVTDYALTTAQENAALSILKDSLDRAAQIELARPEKADETHRELFEELKKRLDALLTVSQRASHP